MKDKILNRFETEANGEKVVVLTIQTDKGILVKVKGSSMDIQVNDEVIYSKFDNQDYKYIPVAMRSFVEKNLCSWGDGIVVKESSVECDIELDGSEYYMQIPKNRAKEQYVYFNNWLEEYEKIQSYDIKIPNAKENFEKLVQDIKNIGYDFEFRWDGNEYDNTYGLKFEVKDFDENKIIKCVELWKEYNAYLDKYIDMI